jgi:thiol-disulfide isomerase/thioredoxin
MPLRRGDEMPSFGGATEWLNAETSVERLLGKPTFVMFWAVSCHICHENMPAVVEWMKQYGPRGLQFVGVHMPRQETDTDVAKVREALAESGITSPTAVDNNHVIGDRFETGGLWPYYLVFDRENKMVSRSAGHAGLGILQPAIERSLAE